MKIGIFSDTHTKLNLAEETLRFLLQEGAEFIIHAGDIVLPATLELLQNCGVRYIAVFGNNDAHLLEYQNHYNLVREPYYFKLADTKFKLMHLPLYMSNDAEVIIFGHTHQFEVLFREGSLYLNPGEVCAREKPYSQAVILDVESKEFIVNYYTKKMDQGFKLNEKFSFERQKCE
jgi:putative phosphoesterase